MTKRLAIPLILLPALLFTTFVWAGTLTGQVISDQGQGLPARVLAIIPQTCDSAETYTTPDGHFTLEVPDGQLLVRATHGPEWSIAEVNTQAGANCVFVLKHLVDMPARGYYGADLHMHSTFSDGKQTPAGVAYACQAEGLQIAALSDHESVGQQPAWLAMATNTFLPLPAQEITTKMGHILGIGVEQVVSNDVSHGPDDFTRIFRQVHEQDAIAIVAHPNAPGENYQAPQVRDYDAWEILNGSVPPYGPIFDFVQGRKVWHSMLSQGLRVAAVGTSDNHDNLSTRCRQILKDPDKATEVDKRLGMLTRIVSFEKVLKPWGIKGLHPGFYRTYLYLPEKTPQAIQTAVKCGNGFVTNGPLLLATLDGQVPGNEVQAKGRPSLNLTVEGFANQPLEKLVILVNGQPALTLNALQAEPTQVTVPAKPGDWIVVELYGQWPEFATTNAWYVR